MKWENTPNNIKHLRILMGLTQKECADLYGTTLRSWQRKEETETTSGSKMSNFEFSYFLLLANEHPDFFLQKRG